MIYSIARAVRPSAASRLVEGRPPKVLMITLYGSSLVDPEVRVMPMRELTWPTPIVIAEPVMNAEIAGREIKSTMKPRRRRPNPRVMPPTMTDRAIAMSSGAKSGCVFWASMTTLPTKVDMTATGPIVMSFEVAKNQ